MTWSSLLVAGAVLAAGALAAMMALLTPLAFGSFIVWITGG